MIDFNPSRFRLPAVAKDVVSAMDAALVAERDGARPRDYLGASAIGEPCLRKIQYRMREPEPFAARTLRIFERGHAGEDRAMRWLRLAGFDLQTEKPGGGQLGFASGGGRFRGHVDGVIHAVPAGLVGRIQTPCLWEHKVLGAKGFRKLEADGLALAYPEYAAQIATYQAYLDLTDPALFMATCADTQAIHIEFVKFDAKLAQRMTDKAVNVLEAGDAEWLPRAYRDRNHYRCKWCAYADVCWEDE